MNGSLLVCTATIHKAGLIQAVISSQELCKTHDDTSLQMRRKCISVCSIESNIIKENEILEQRLHRTNEQIAELEKMLAKSKAVEQEMSNDISKIPGLLTENERY